MGFKWYILGKKEYEVECRVIEEEERWSSKEWEQWKDIHERISAKCEINNLIRAIRMNEIYKEILKYYGSTVDIDIEIAKLKTKKKYKERLYRENRRLI